MFPVAGCQRELFVCFKEVLTKISDESKQQILDTLPAELKTKYILTYYWTDWDRHGSINIRVTDLFT